MKRDSIPTDTRRAVLVEAGHRCAIPTCRATTTEIAHIVPWAKAASHSFENLIALCPNCHTRYDQKKEIDLLSMKAYKANLGIVNHRYGEFERRLFHMLAKSGERVFVLGIGGDLIVANAAKDGLFEDKKIDGPQWTVTDTEGRKKDFPLTFTYWLTDSGLEFLKRYSAGESIQ